MISDSPTKMDARRQKLLTVGALLGWCMALLGFRMHLAPDGLAVGLMWNLFLATVPLFWSTAFRIASERERPLAQVLSFSLWLLFLPNAPYILTDLIHLGPRPHVPLWFLLAMLLSCAATGTLLGYLSLLDVHAVIEARFGRVAGWAIAVGSLLGCGFGIYVGRFLRWNSWDAVTRPLQLLKSMAWQFIDSGPNPHPIPVTLVFGMGLVVGYLALRVASTPAVAR